MESSRGEMGAGQVNVRDRWLEGMETGSLGEELCEGCDGGAETAYVQERIEG